MVHSVTNSNTFLAYFNHVDKFLEVVLGISSYLPFAEKVEKVAHGNYPVTSFVKKYHQKLKYFGDLRNQVVHGFRLDQHHYLLASDYAVEQIKTVYERLTKPPSVTRFLRDDIPVLSPHSTLKEAIAQFVRTWLAGMPIYDGVTYVDTILVHQIVSATLHEWFLDQSVASRLDTPKGQICFLPAHASVYEVEWLFSVDVEDEDPVELIRISKDWTPDEPLTWIITAKDLPKLDQEIIL